jgi:hypothetical protein
MERLTNTSWRAHTSSAASASRREMRHANAARASVLSYFCVTLFLNPVDAADRLSPHMFQIRAGLRPDTEKNRAPPRFDNNSCFV